MMVPSSQHQQHVHDHEHRERHVDRTQPFTKHGGQAGDAQHAAVDGGGDDEKEDVGGDVPRVHQRTPDRLDVQAPLDGPDDGRRHRTCRTRLYWREDAAINAAQHYAHQQHHGAQLDHAFAEQQRQWWAFVACGLAARQILA